MSVKNSAHYQREFRRRLREQGLVKKEVWIKPENAKRLSAVEKQLRETLESETFFEGVNSMAEEIRMWTTESLFQELQAAELFRTQAGTIELIDGVASSLHIVMNEYGDLPIFLSVSGDQILVESVLWSIDDVVDVSKFNEAVLRTHKFFPLSTISLDKLSDGQEYYMMFGALSSSSIIQNIIFEIEALASNVIQATEAYYDFLSSSDQKIGDGK